MKRFRVKINVSYTTIGFFIIWFVAMCGLYKYIIDYTEEVNVLLVNNNPVIKSLPKLLFMYSIVIIIPLTSLLLVMFKIGEYKNYKAKIELKALRVISYYCSLIIIISVLTFILEIAYSLEDKANELVHYSTEHEKYWNNTNYIIEKYEAKGYLKGKMFNYWADDTMYIEGGFTNEFSDFLKTRNREKLENIIYKNNDIVKVFIEDIYYVIQMTSTIGYGDIVANNYFSKVVTIITSLLSQFILIFGVVLIIRENSEDSDYSRISIRIK